MKNISHTLQETSWWLLLLVGIVAIIISIVALIIPHQLTVLIVRLLGGYWLLTGVLSLSIAFLLAVLPLVVSFCSVVISVFLVTHALRRHRHLQEPPQSMSTMQEQ